MVAFMVTVLVVIVAVSLPLLFASKPDSRGREMEEQFFRQAEVRRGMDKVEVMAASSTARKVRVLRRATRPPKAKTGTYGPRAD